MLQCKQRQRQRLQHAAAACGMLTALRPGSRLLLLMGQGARALMPTSMAASWAVSLTQPCTRMPAQPLAAAWPARRSPSRAHLHWREWEEMWVARVGGDGQGRPLAQSSSAGQYSVVQECLLSAQAGRLAAMHGVHLIPHAPRLRQGPGDPPQAAAGIHH